MCCRCGTGRCRCCSGSGRARPTRAGGRYPAGASTPPTRWSARSGITSPRRWTSASSRTSSSWRRAPTKSRRVTTAYLGLVRTGLDPAVPEDTRWHPVATLPPTAFDHGAIALAARERLRAKLSYTNLGFALAPETFTISELRDLYTAALGHDVSATNLQRVLLRRGVLAATGRQRPSGRAGGRPAAVYRFRSADLEITDQFAVLRPPSR